MSKERYAFRYGLSTDVPNLLLGEGGWDVDTKTMRVGDDTSSPPRVLTNKSLGTFSYPNISYVEYPEIRLIEGGTVDGVYVGAIHQDIGFLVYGVHVDENGAQTNRVVHRELETDEYLSVDNSRGRFGNPRISVSNTLLELIERLSQAGGFSWGEDPPTDANPGHMFWSTLDDLLYILITDGNERRWWMDITSAGGGGGGVGNRTWLGATPPINPLIGDSFIDLEDNHRRYLYTRDADSIYWIETRL